VKVGDLVRCPKNTWRVGDLVRHDMGFIGIITDVDPKGVGDISEVKVAWNDGDVCNMSVFDLEVLNESR